ncbi:hypothetical protein ACG0Z4_20875 [Enterocloster aldenensis]|uniref:hypothetical protein n=1 Tax=Enterocloster aldenensis TaxID=358742 RepID=UPI004028B0B3
MARRKERGEMPRLTLKKARELVIQEFGTAKGLEAEPNAPKGYFQMYIGKLCVRVRNDYPRESGCIVLSVCMDSGRGYFEQYHDPDTLEESFDAEDRARRHSEHEALKDWVGTNGPEVCHATIDRVWNEPC